MVQLELEGSKLIRVFIRLLNYCYLFCIMVLLDFADTFSYFCVNYVAMVLLDTLAETHSIMSPLINLIQPLFPKIPKFVSDQSLFSWDWPGSELKLY